VSKVRARRQTVATMLRNQRWRYERAVFSRVDKLRAGQRAALLAMQARLSKLIVTGKGETFSAFQLRLAIEQVRESVRALERSMGATLRLGADEMLGEGARQTRANLVRLESVYKGTLPRIPVAEGAVFAGAYAGVQSSLLASIQSSVARYGGVLIAAGEQALMQTLLTGGTQQQAANAVQSAMQVNWWQAERIARTECFPGDTLVDGAVVRAVYRRWYEGSVVQVVTAAGRKFTATPNHPMLTRRGWVGAGQLSNQDYLICDARKQRPCAPGNEDVAARPTPISEVFDTLAAIGVGERRRTAEPDFHGDGTDGEVHVHYANGALPVGCMAPIREPDCQAIFAPSDKARPAFCSSCGGLLRTDGACGADYLPGRPHSFDDGAGSDVEGCGEFQRRFAGNVAPHNLITDVHGFMQTHGARLGSLGLRAQNDAVLFDLAPNTRCVFAQKRGNACDAYAAVVELDRVVDVKFSRHVGPVYNLATVQGYYSVANGAYTSNCAYAFNAAAALQIRDDALELGDLMGRWSELVDDLTGAPYDDRVAADSLALHGQIARPGGSFTMPVSQNVSPKLWGKSWQYPPNRPQDRACLGTWRPHWYDIPAWYYSAAGGRVDVTPAMRRAYLRSSLRGDTSPDVLAELERGLVADAQPI